MRLVTFTDGQYIGLGALADNGIVDFSGLGLPTTMFGFINAGPDTWQKASRLVKQSPPPVLRQ
jgi:hypothetical protein